MLADFTRRTFTRNDAPEPRPPPGVSVLTPGCASSPPRIVNDCHRASSSSLTAVARKADTTVGLRSMHTGTITSPAHANARACCPGVISSLKGRGIKSLAKRCGRRVVPQQWLSRTTAPQVHPETVPALISLSTEQRATAKPCAATQTSSPLSRRGRESRLSGRADAKSRATRS